MCWKSNVAHEYMVNKPIKVFKILFSKSNDNTYESLIQGFHYELNKLYKLEKEIEVSYNGISNIINEGFHSYSFYYGIEKKAFGNNKLIGLVIPGQCIDSYRPNDLSIIECEIPKGAIYYLNGNGEYVSDQIILKRVVAEWNTSGEVIKGKFVNGILKF